MSIYEYLDEVRECDIPRMKRNKLEDLACDLMRSHKLLESRVSELQSKLFAIINAVDDAQDVLPNPQDNRTPASGGPVDRLVGCEPSTGETK